MTKKKTSEKKKKSAGAELPPAPRNAAPAGDVRIARLPLLQCLGMAHQRNPKEHDVQSLVASIRRFGFIAPPTIDEASGVMVAGHGRCEALEVMFNEAPTTPPPGIELSERGEWMVPVVRGISFANESERDAYVIADNQQVMAGGWKFDLLGEILGELRDAGGFEGLGFEEIELNSLLGNVNNDDPSGGFDPEAGGSSGSGDSGSHGGASGPSGGKARTEITARIECPNCGHMIDR